MGARKGAATRPCGESHPGRLRDLKARAPTAQSERREGPGLPMRRRMARAARPRRPHGRSDRAASRLVSAAANPLSGRPLRPPESKMEGAVQVRFYRVCTDTSQILQADRRMVPPPATDSACKQDGRVVQMRFSRVCGHTSYILQLEERPRSVSARKGARGTVSRGAAAPIHRPGHSRGYNPESR